MVRHERLTVFLIEIGFFVGTNRAVIINCIYLVLIKKMNIELVIFSNVILVTLDVDVEIDLRYEVLFYI